MDSLLVAHDEAASFGDRPVVPFADGVKRLAPGSRVGAFRIEALLGAGGMGEVYRARDTRLGRAVAIKVLPDLFAQDVERRARFDQEARALAALNHPLIGAIYGVEENDDVAALVLELVEGPTLAETLAAGPLPMDEVVAMARQMAEALEAAHDRGIIHRDLKPANIKITPDGVVKVLDFGLAKAVGWPEQAVAPRDDAVTLRDDAGVPAQGTRVGLVVGTPAYMSPEQARGHRVDKRTDIWAFGCVVFEMCAGRPAFAGDSLSGTLTAVLEREPDWARLRADTPPSLRRLLRRCLTKDPKQRLRDIGEARIALSGSHDAEPPDAVARPRPTAAMVAAAGALLAGALLAVVLYARVAAPDVAPAPSVRFAVPPPDGGTFVLHPARTFFALSPDGSRLAFVAVTDRPRVWLRALADIEPRPVPGTEGATSVFWSPDGRSLAFFAEAKLKRVDLPGGAVVAICDVPVVGTAHGTWGAGGIILFGSSQGSTIFRVASSGGSPSPLLTPDRANREVRAHWPSFLPDGRRFLYTARSEDGGGVLHLGSLDGGARALMPIASNAQWIEPDIVVFAREGVLMGQRVDPARAATIGEPWVIAEHVEYILTTSRAMFSVSRAGTIAYHAYRDLSQLVWADGSGNELESIGGVVDHQFQSTRLSADGLVLLTAPRQPGVGTSDVWRTDLVRKIEERLTDDRGADVTPILSEDGRTVFFAADRRGSVPSLFRRNLVTGVEEPLLPPGVQQLVMDVIPGGRGILYIQRSKQGTFDIFRLPLEPGASPEPVLESRHDKWDARVSPDGRAIAFAGSDGPRTDLYVAPFPISSAPIVAAAGVRGPPRWSADSRRVHYLGADDMVMTVAVGTGPRLTVGTPQPQFRLKRPAMLADVSRDGRFLLLVRQVHAAEQPLTVATAAVGGGRP